MIHFWEFLPFVSFYSMSSKITFSSAKKRATEIIRKPNIIHLIVNQTCFVCPNIFIYLTIRYLPLFVFRALF